jgi:mono/diheme cytochrome c family protein
MRKVIGLWMGIMISGAVLMAADAAAGKVAYDRACKSCHGVDGAPNEKIAAAMKVEMRHLGANEVQALSDAQLKTIITEGKGKMKPVRSITASDADNVVAYVRSLKH